MNNSTQQIQRRGNDRSNATTTTIKQIKKRGNGGKSRQHEQAEKTLLGPEMYRDLFENAVDMIVLVDGETGTILDINTAGCNLLGVPKKKIIGQHQSTIHPPELADVHTQRFQAHVRGGGTKIDNVIVQRADGTHIHMDVSATVVKLADKTVIQGIFRDVTEHVGMEKALRESVEKFSKAFYNLPDQVSIVRKKDQVFIDVNETFCRNNGYTRDKIIGRKGDELNLSIKPSAWTHVKKMVKEQGYAENVEIEFKDKSGKTRTMLFSTDNINIGGEPCLLTIGNDISQRKQAEKFLRESEEKFSKAFHASPEAMGIITEKDSKFIDVNDSYVQMTGYSREELIGKTTASTNLWLTPEDKEKINKTLLKKGRVHKEETDYRTKSGEIRTRLLSLERITINGEPCRIGVSTDITKIKRMEQALKESEEKFSKAFDSSPEAIAIVSAKDERYIDANDNYTKMFGFSRKELIGKKAFEDNWATPESYAKMQNILQKKSRIHNEEFNYRTKSGEIRTRLLSLEPIILNGEPCRIGFSTDITERKAMEEALLESEEKFSKAFQSSPEAIAIVTLKDGKFIDVNDSYVRMTGYSREEIIGHTTTSLNLAVDLEGPKIINRIMHEKGRIYNEELDYRTKSGEIRTRLFSLEPITIKGEPCRFSVSIDITERKRIEQALQVSEEKFSKAFRTLPEQVTIVRIKDGVFIDVNESFCRYNGYTREEVIGRRREELDLLIGPRPRAQFTKIMKEKGRAENIELECKNKSGETRTLLFSAEIINIGGEPCQLTIANDITERKRTEQALKESEEKFSRIFQASPDAASLITVDDERYIDINESYLKMTGYSREELVGNTAYSINLWVNEENHDRMHKMMREKGRIYNEEFEYRTKSGEIRTRLFSLEPTIINGKPCTIGVSTDITERKRMEHALKESEEKFSKAFRSIPEVVTLVRMKDGVFIDVNETFCRNNGYTREEVIGRTGKELNLPVKPSDWARVTKMVKEHGRAEDVELEFKDKAGELHTMLFSSDIIDLASEPCLLTIGKDITERKRIEQALQVSEEKFSKAFQAMPEEVTLVRMKDNTFIDVNETFCRNNGYTREEIIGRKGEDLNLLIKSSEWARITKMVKEHGRADNLELEFSDESGEIHTLLFSSDIINLGGEPCLLTIGKDITDRKQAEEKLRQSEEFSLSLLENAPNPIEVINPDMSTRYVNKAFEELTGFTSAEVSGRKPPYLWWPEELRKELVDAIKKDLADSTITEKADIITRKETALQNKKGERLWAELSIVPLKHEDTMAYLLINWVDITERKQMEQALKESEEKFAKAFQASPDAMGIVRVKDGQFIDVNDSYIQMTGYSREELTGNTAYSREIWVSAKDNNKINKILEEKGRIHNEEVDYRTKSGEIRTRLLSLEPINISGEPCRIGVSTDITERKEAEKKLKEALADLEQSSALLKSTNKELESFSYSVSHDLRSPLRSIAGFSQALLEDYSTKLDETGKDYLNRLSNASQKMGELIDGLLKLSRLTRSEMHHEQVDLTSLANEIAARLQETNPERKVEFIIGNDLKANGDPQMLRVLLENLLGNALKFTKNTKQACIEFGSINEGGRKTFFIKDNGAGFDMAFEKKLFGAFQRLHDEAEYPGTGIGLATVQRIINRHGGSIRAEGEVNKGATFYFTLS